MTNPNNKNNYFFEIYMIEYEINNKSNFIIINKHVNFTKKTKTIFNILNNIEIKNINCKN